MSVTGRWVSKREAKTMQDFLPPVKKVWKIKWLSIAGSWGSIFHLWLYENADKAPLRVLNLNFFLYAILLNMLPQPPVYIFYFYLSIFFNGLEILETGG
jgi:hypothetical protein